MMRTGTQRQPGASARRAYTLLEVVLATAISVLIMYGLYLAIDIQVRSAESGRAVVAQATLSRSLMNLIANDIAPCVGIPDPGRYRSSRSQSSSSPTGGTQTGGTQTGDTQTGDMGTDAQSTDMGTGALLEDEASIDLVRAFVGDQYTLRIFVSRVPRVQTGELIGPEAQNVDQQLAVRADQRLVTYWLVDGVGLAREEIFVVTANAQETRTAVGTADEAAFVIAPEVKGLEFQYFDGTTWLTNWDGRLPGADGKTPQGPPLAVAIVMQIQMPGRPEVRTYRHVVAIPTANGIAQPDPLADPAAQQPMTAPQP